MTVHADSGAGPVVVLLHGFPDLPASWDPIRLRLNAAGYRTVVPWLRGYHADSLDGRGFSTREQAEDVVALLDSLGVASAAVVGHDWGASATYAVATLFPERVTCAVTFGIPHPATLKPSLAAAVAGRHFVWFKLPWAAASARLFGLRMVDRLYRRWAPSWTGPVRDASVAAAVEAFRDPRVLAGALSYYKALEPGDKVFRARISVPMLVVGGKDEPAVLQAAYAATPRRFTADCEVRVLDGAGHWPHREHEDVSVDLLLAALSTQGG